MADARPLRAKATTRKPASTKLHTTSGADMASAKPTRTVACGMAEVKASAVEQAKSLHLDFGIHLASSAPRLFPRSLDIHSYQDACRQRYGRKDLARPIFATPGADPHKG